MPTRGKLKNVLLHCRDLTFVTYYSHIKAHQDDQMAFKNLSRKAQLNCICNHAVKYRIAKDGIEKPPPGKISPSNLWVYLSRGERWRPTWGATFGNWRTINWRKPIIEAINFCCYTNSMSSTGSPSTSSYTTYWGSFNCGRQSTYLALQGRWNSCHIKTDQAHYAQAVMSAMKHASTLSGAQRQVVLLRSYNWQTKSKNGLTAMVHTPT